MTTPSQLDAKIKTSLKEDGGAYLSEEIRAKWCSDSSMHQVSQSLSRLMTDGCVLGKNQGDSTFKLYSYNYLYDGTRLINSVWRKKK